MSCEEMLGGEENLGGTVLDGGIGERGPVHHCCGSKPSPAFQPSWKGPDTWPGKGAGIKGWDVQSW